MRHYKSIAQVCNVALKVVILRCAIVKRKLCCDGGDDPNFLKQLAEKLTQSWEKEEA